MIRKLLTTGAILCLAAGTASAETKLSFWHIWNPDGAQGKIYEEYVAEFEAANPDVKVDMVVTPSDVYFQKLTAAFASGEAPDLFALTYRRLSEFVGTGAIAPIDEAAVKAMGVGSLDEFKASWASGVLEAYEADGNFYGVPVQFNIYAWIINADHFREAGLDPVADAPKTWEDVLTVAEKLVQKDANGRVTRQALSFPFSEGAAWYLLELEPMIRELGGSLLNADQTESVVNSEAGVRAMEEIKRRFDLGVSDKDIAATLDYYRDGFATGRFSMTVGGNWGIPRWQKNFPDIVGEDTFLAIPTPVFADGTTVSSTTSWSLATSSVGDNTDLAWKFANFLTSQPNRHLAATGDILPRAGWSQSEAAKDIPQAEFWENMLQYSKPLAKMPQYTEISEVLKSAMQSILLSGEDIQATLDRAKSDIDAILKRG